MLFDSKSEAAYARTLDTLRSAKADKDRVVSWTRQVSYPIVINGLLCCKYIADFVVIYADGHEEVVDVKGFKTAIYKLKKKLIKAVAGVDIIEV